MCNKKECFDTPFFMVVIVEKKLYNALVIVCQYEEKGHDKDFGWICCGDYSFDYSRMH